jgi:hypothetical protein
MLKALVRLQFKKEWCYLPTRRDTRASRFLTMVGGTTAAAVALSTTFVLRGKVGTVSANRAQSVRRLSLLKHPEKWRSVDGISIAFEFVSDRDAEIALGRRGRNEAWRNSPLSGGIQKLLTTLRESRL